MVDDLRPGQVQHELVAALGPWPTGDPDRPIRVVLEQPAPRADHLRLDPQPEAEPERLDLGGEPVDPAWQLAPIDDPVAQRAVVRIPGAEPPVIEDEQLDPEVAGGGGDVEQPRLVEVEVGRFPGVEEDRPWGVAPAPACEALAIQRVERIAHRPESGVRIGQDGLGRRECVAGLQRPAEGVRADPEPDARRVEHADLDLLEVVARIDQAEAEDLAVGLGGRRALERDERVVLVAR